MGHIEDLKVYAKAFELSMELFNHSKHFPEDERYGLTSQVRRSSRSVCSNIAEGYRKRKYPAHFISKLTDADMENSETQTWIEFAFKCGYIDLETKQSLRSRADEVGRLLNYMMNNHTKFI